MTHSVNPILGVDLDRVYTAAEIAATEDLGTHALGQQVWGDDGKLYVFAEANAAISASTAVCDVNASTFLVAATGGAYTSPATAMADGDQGWFFKDSV